MNNNMIDGSSRPEKNSTWDDVRVCIHHDAVCDLDEVRRAIPILFGAGEFHELRPLPSARSQIVSCDDLEGACLAVQSVSDQQVYYSLNPISPGSARASKKTVTGRRWFLIDVDTVRPEVISSVTDDEKLQSQQVAMAILDYLSQLGWPSPIVVDSGNGWHLLYRIDLPNDSLSHQIIKDCLYSLAGRFDDPHAKVDRSTHDAPRIAKMPGTVARKGLDTPDRPHRPCKIVWGDHAEVVPIDLLKVLGSPQSVPDSKNGQSPHDPWPVVVGQCGGLLAYVRRAVESECFRVAMSVGGNRNNSLNAAAFSLGTMAGWPEMDEVETRSLLIRAGERSGLEPRECLTTVASGWEAGRLCPRDRPTPASTSAPVAAATANESLTEGLDEIEPEEVAWLYENRIAPGFISIFAGRTGMGKSFVVCDLVAHLSRGEKLPFSNLIHPPMRTLFISEDSPRKVIGPRLIELRAVRPLVRFMKFKAMAQYTIDNTAMLTKAYEESGRPELVVIDPPANFLGEVDEHRNSEVRKILFILVEWLEKYNVSCVMIMHINKQVGKGLDAVERILGSVAWGSSARMTIAFNKDPNDPSQLLCGGTKNNLGAVADVLAYKIVKTDSLARVEWIGKVDTSMEDAMNLIKKKTRAQNATEWLIDRFREERTWPSDRLYEFGKVSGVSRSAIWEAAQNLPLQRRIETPQDGGPRYWTWTAKDGWPVAFQTPAETVETLKRSDHTLNNGSSESNDSIF